MHIANTELYACLMKESLSHSRPKILHMHEIKQSRKLKSLILARYGNHNFTNKASLIKLFSLGNASSSSSLAEWYYHGFLADLNQETRG